MTERPDYAKIAQMEIEIFGRVFTVDEARFRSRCPHCRTINQPEEGMAHAYGCPYIEIQTRSTA